MPKLHIRLSNLFVPCDQLTVKILLRINEAVTERQFDQRKVTTYIFSFVYDSNAVAM